MTRRKAPNEGAVYIQEGRGYLEPVPDRAFGRAKIPSGARLSEPQSRRTKSLLWLDHEVGVRPPMCNYPGWYSAELVPFTSLSADDCASDWEMGGSLSGYTVRFDLDW